MPLKTKIFVAKLPPSVEDFRLKKLFERFGEVTEVANMGNYAFVHMATEDQAKDAIENLNNYEIDGVSINVVPSTGEKRSGGDRGGGGGGGRGGGGRGGFRGGRGGPPMGRGGPMGRPGPYDRPPMDRFGPPMRDRYDSPMDRYGPPMGDRYGPIKRGFDEYDRMDRRPLPPVDRRPLPMDDRRPMSMDDRRPLPMDDRRPMPMSRDPYDRYDAYDRMGRRSPPPPPSMGGMGRRSPPPMDRRAPMLGYDRRDDLYGRRPAPERDPYGAPGGGMDRFSAARERSPPRGFGGGMSARDPIPPRRF